MKINVIAIVMLQLVFGLTAFSQPTPAKSSKRSFEETRRLFKSPQSGVILVASHRGTHNDVPENSLASFREAMKIGVDIIELDIRATKDGVLILMHDGKVDRTTNGKGRVDSLTFAEIRKLRLIHNGKVTNEKVPTFQEALRLTKNKILIDLDIKADDHVKEIIAMVKKEKALHSVVFFVYEPKEIKSLREMDKECLILARSYKPEEIAPFFTGDKADAIHIDPKQHNENVVGDILNRGGRVWINALGDVDKKVAAGKPEAFEESLQYGVNIVQTDYPKILIDYLKTRSE